MTAEQYSQELTSISTHGFVLPIVARPDGADFQIIDGENRWRVAKDLSITSVPVFVLGGIDETRAKKLTLVLNELHGQVQPDKLGALLTDLLQQESLASLIEQLPFPESMIRGLVDLPTQSLPPLEPVAKAPNKWVERIFRLPPEVAEVLDQALEKARGGEDMESWQALEVLAAEYLAS